MKFGILALLEAKPGKEAAVSELLQSAVARARREPDRHLVRVPGRPSHVRHLRFVPRRDRSHGAPPGPDRAGPDGQGRGVARHAARRPQGRPARGEVARPVRTRRTWARATRASRSATRGSCVAATPRVRERACEARAGHAVAVALDRRPRAARDPPGRGGIGNMNARRRRWPRPWAASP